MAHKSMMMLALCAAFLVAAEAKVDASLTSPLGEGGKPPMFILFTHDDAINDESHALMLDVTEGRQSANGCPATATMFVCSPGTDCELTMDLYNKGYEIADHTLHHESIRGIGAAAVEAEILGGKATLVKCGVPKEDVVGLRAPYLNTDETVRKVLSKEGFLYESSLIEVLTGDSVSKGVGERVWPFTADDGVPLDCAWFSTFQSCSTSESDRGLWVVPVWHIMDPAGHMWSMDYGVGPDGDVEASLKYMFDAAYSGNRAPLPLYIHAPWLADKKNSKAVKNFLDYALAKPDVYAVTMRQLINWMENPVPADQLTPEALGCGKPGGAGGDLSGSGASSSSSSSSSLAAGAPAPAPSADLGLSVDAQPPSSDAGSSGSSDSSSMGSGN